MIIEAICEMGEVLQFLSFLLSLVPSENVCRVLKFSKRVSGKCVGVVRTLEIYLK